MADVYTNTNAHGVQVASNPDSEERCVVCLEGLRDSCQLVPCGHYNFHVDCIQEWFAVSSLCPLCNAFVWAINTGPRTPRPLPAEEIANSPAARLAARLWPRSSSSSSSPRRRYTPADFAAAGAAYARATASAPAPSTTPAPYTHANVAATGVPYTHTTTYAHATTYAPPTALSFGAPHRRVVYTRGLYSLHVQSNIITRHRDFSPFQFRHDATWLQIRARAFLHRELRVFDFLTTAGVAYFVEFIVAMLKTMDPTSTTALQLLAPELGQGRAAMLLHELKAWLRSPYASLTEWDHAVQYPPAEGWMGTMEQQQQQQQQQQPVGVYQFTVWLCIKFSCFTTEP